MSFNREDSPTLELMIEWPLSRTVTDVAGIAHDYAILPLPIQTFCACTQAACADSCVQHIHGRLVHGRYRKGAENISQKNLESLKRWLVRLPETKKFWCGLTRENFQDGTVSLFCC